MHCWGGGSMLDAARQGGTAHINGSCALKGSVCMEGVRCIHEECTQEGVFAQHTNALLLPLASRCTELPFVRGKYQGSPHTAAAAAAAAAAAVMSLQYESVMLLDLLQKGHPHAEEKVRIPPIKYHRGCLLLGQGGCFQQLHPVQSLQTLCRHGSVSMCADRLQLPQAAVTRLLLRVLPLCLQ
jgi:hypothetical protein